MKIFALEAARGRETEVTELVYRSPGPDAPFPEAIGRLVNLRRLEVEGGRFPCLPKVLDHLPRLESLRFSGTGLMEAGEVLGRLAQLRQLDLSNNQLSRWPEELRPLIHLESLNLSDNQLTSVPPAIGRLAQLRRLDLNGNRISRLSRSLGKCSHLRYLDLSGNRLRKLPSTTGRLTQLSLLNLSHNQLKTVPQGLENANLLQRFYLRGNRLQELPPALLRLTWLTHLDLSDNRLEALPESLSDLARLEVLGLGRNQLSRLPVTMQRLARLARLDLSHNRLDDLPPLPRRLQHLDLSDNEFPAPPREILTLTDLSSLDLSGNPITTFSDDWQSLRHLRRLLVRRNPVRCEPQALLEWRNLEHLEGLLHPRTTGHLLDFLAALRRSTGLPEELTKSLFSVFRGNRKDLASLPLSSLLTALSFDLPAVQLQVMAFILRNFGPGRRSPLKPGDRLAPFGRLASGRENWQQRLEVQGVRWQEKPDMKTTHLLLGEAPFDGPVPEASSLICVSEPAVLRWLDRKEKRHLVAPTDPEKNKKLRQLLLHTDARNVRTALQLLRGGGVPAALLTDLFLAWCRAVKDPVLVQDIEQVMRPYLSATARQKLDQARDLADMLASVRQFGFFRYRKTTIEEKMNALAKGTEWEVSRLLTYLEELTR